MTAMAALMISCNSQKQDDTFSFDEMTYSPKETVFKLFAPKDAECYVKVGTDSIAMTLVDSIWTATMPGDLKGKEYVFVVNGQSSPGVFAKAVTVNGEKGVILDMRETNPRGWAVRPAARGEVACRPRHLRDAPPRLLHRRLLRTEPQGKVPGID